MKYFDKRRIIFFIAQSGSGKGTQAELLEKYMRENSDIPYITIGSGNLIREYNKTSDKSLSMNKKLVENYEAGQLAPSFLPSFLVIKEILAQKDQPHIIFDGSPRTVTEATILKSVIVFLEIIEPIIITFKITEEEALRRLVTRNRADNMTEDSFKNKLAFYYEKNGPKESLEFFVRTGDFKLLQLDGMKSIEEVHKDIIDAIIS